jgi:hypothetical protein
MFLLVYDSYIGGFDVTFPYMHILNLSLVHSTNLPLLPLPFLEMTLTGFNVLYSYMYRKYLNHIHPYFTLFIYLPSPTSILPLT